MRPEVGFSKHEIMIPEPAERVPTVGSKKTTAELLKKLREKHGNGYRASVPLEIVKGRYAVRTARNWSELWRVLELRHEVFWVEQRGCRKPFGVDIDRIDLLCDHLGIFDRESGAVLGSYRLTSSLYSEEFYCDERFDLSALVSLPCNKLELGRACVEKSARGTTLLHLLWRGIVEYSRLTGTKYLFGVSSVPRTHPEQIARTLHALEDRDLIQKSMNIVPFRDWRAPGLAIARDEVRNMAAEPLDEILPPLFRFYLRAGARVCGEPAWDVEMSCSDYLTLHDLEATNDRHRQKYLVPEDATA